MNFVNGFLRKSIRKLYWVLSAQFGVDPRKAFRSLRGLPQYVRDYVRFRVGYAGRLELLPCLHDWYEEGGTRGVRGVVRERRSGRQLVIWVSEIGRGVAYVDLVRSRTLLQPSSSLKGRNDVGNENS
jgi:hypothetical protein